MVFDTVTGTDSMGKFPRILCSIYFTKNNQNWVQWVIMNTSCIKGMKSKKKNGMESKRASKTNTYSCTNVLNMSIDDHKL